MLGFFAEYQTETIVPTTRAWIPLLRFDLHNELVHNLCNNIMWYIKSIKWQPTAFREVFIKWHSLEIIITAIVCSKLKHIAFILSQYMYINWRSIKCQPFSYIWFISSIMCIDLCDGMRSRQDDVAWKISDVDFPIYTSISMAFRCETILLVCQQ